MKGREPVIPSKVFISPNDIVSARALLTPHPFSLHFSLPTFWILFLQISKLVLNPTRYPLQRVMSFVLSLLSSLILFPLIDNNFETVY